MASAPTTTRAVQYDYDLDVRDAPNKDQSGSAQLTNLPRNDPDQTQSTSSGSGEDAASGQRAKGPSLRPPPSRAESTRTSEARKNGPTAPGDSPRPDTDKGPKSTTEKALEEAGLLAATDSAKETPKYMLRRGSKGKSFDSPVREVQEESKRYDKSQTPPTMPLIGQRGQTPPTTPLIGQQKLPLSSVKQTSFSKDSKMSPITELPKDNFGVDVYSADDVKDISLKGVLKSAPRESPRDKISRDDARDLVHSLAVRSLKHGSKGQGPKGSHGVSDLTQGARGDGSYSRRNQAIPEALRGGAAGNLSLAKDQDTISQDLKVLEMKDFADTLEHLDGADSNEADFDSAELLEDLAEAMRTNVRIASEINLDHFPRGFRDKLQGIRNIGHSFEALSDEVTSKALALLDHDQENRDDRPEADSSEASKTGADPLAEVFKRRAYLRAQWLGLRRLLFCVDLQLRHAAGYHLFFEDARALKRLMLDFHKQLQQEELLDAEGEDSEDGTSGKHVDLEDLKKTAAYLQSLQTNVQDVVKRSANIVPLPKRKEPLTEGLDIQVVSALSSDNFDLGEGEPLTLLDNTAPYKWRVRTAEGVEGEVPAAYCVIPPPDPDAVLAAAQLEEAMASLMDRYIETMKARLLKYSKGVLDPILEKADPLLKKLTADRKKEILSDLENLEDACDDLFSNLAGYPKLEQTEKALQRAVHRARLSISEDPRVGGEVAEPIGDLYDMLGELQDLVKKRQAAKEFAVKHGLENYLDDDNLDWVVELLDNPERGVAISVEHQETEVTETTSFTHTTGEVRQTFSVSAVLDPRFNRRLSIDQATDMGILDQPSGIYLNPLSRETLPIQEAINAGLIVVDGTQTKLINGPTKEVGLVTVNVTRENRPYTIKRVRDPHTHEELNVVEAIERGVFDASKGTWINPAIKEVVDAKNAIDSGLLIVEYDQDEATDPEVTSRTFAVYSIMDRRQGKRLPFDEACRRGLIDRERGVFRDNRAGLQMPVIEAAKLGYVKMRVVEGISRLERFVSRDRSDSLDSVASGSSYG